MTAPLIITVNDPTTCTACEGTGTVQGDVCPTCHAAGLLLAPSYAECLTCTGAGEVGTGDRERETGVWVTVDCHSCKGDGTVDAEHVQVCACCAGAFWAGAGCDHRGEPLCSSCKGRCTDCTDEARADSGADDPWAVLLERRSA